MHSGAGEPPGKGEGPGDLLNQSWEARTGWRGGRVPGWSLGGREKEMGGGRRGQRSRPDTDSSVAPSLGSAPRPHFSPPRAPSSILRRPSVLTPGVVPLLRPRVITSPHCSTWELSPPAPGSGASLCRGGFLLGFIGGQSLEKGVRVPERRPPPTTCPQRACRRVSAPSISQP